MTDAISASALVADVAPYILAVGGVAVPTLVGLGLAEVRKLTGLKIQQSAADKFDKMIEDEVGALVAAAPDNLATTSIKFGSPLVASIANEIVAAAPGLLETAGIDPTAVANMVHGEIGKWQASMTSVAPAPGSPAA